MSSQVPTGWSHTTLRSLLDAIAVDAGRLRPLVEATDVPVIAFDAKRKILCANASAEAYFGYATHGLDGTCIDELVPPRLRQAEAPPPLVTPDIMHVALPGLRRDGVEIPAEWGVGGVVAGKGPEARPIFLTAVRNPVEASRSLEALRQSEERARTLLEGVPDFAIFMLDADGRVITWNAGAERIKGYPADEIMGQHFSRFYTDEERAAGIPEGALDMARKDGRCELEGWRVRKDGTRFWAGTILTRLQDAEGQHIGFAKVTRDLTERRQAEENTRRLFEERLAREAAERAEAAAHQHGRQLRMLAEVSHFFASATLDTDAMLAEFARVCAELTGDGCTVMVPVDAGEMVMKALHQPNRQAAKIAEPLIGKRVPADGVSGKVLQTGRAVIIPVVDPVPFKESRALYAAVLERVPVYSVLAVPLKANGKLVAAATLSRHVPGKPFTAHDLALVEDLCDRIGLALDNVRLYQDLRAAVRARDELMAVVSHDLRNPLASIIGSASLLGRGSFDDSNRARELGERIVKAGRRLDRLVQDLVDRARLEAGKPLAIEPLAISAAELVKEALENLEPLAAQHGVQVDRDALAEVAHVKADAGRLQQVFSNLLNNALRYTPEGGRIALRAKSDGSEVVFEIADTGAGIPPEALPRIFEPYWQGSSDNRRGLGLGLAVCRAVVDAHGGRIRVESAVGRGTTFFISLPEHRP